MHNVLVYTFIEVSIATARASEAHCIVDTLLWVNPLAGF